MCNSWKLPYHDDLTTDDYRKAFESDLFRSIEYVGITGGEPTLRRDMVDLVRIMSDNMPRLRKMTLNTNGFVTERVVPVLEGIIDVANEVLTLVEETEFGIALPAALRVVRRSMIGVRRSLKQGDASKQVVTAERQVEEDLKTLIDAMKEMPASRISSRRAQRDNARDRQRELNRLIAELKMIRLLQVRVNGETIEVDGKRPDRAKSLSAAIQTAIEDVETHQEDVLLTTQQLSEERGEEIQQPQ